jgi:Flp pilus assembly protein TadG
LALLLPFVCGLLLALVQTALVARDQILLQHATRETARAVALDGDIVAATAAGRSAVRLVENRLELSIEGAGDSGLFTVRGRYRSPVALPVLNLIRREVTLDTQLVVQAEIA